MRRNVTDEKTSAVPGATSLPGNGAMTRAGDADGFDPHARVTVAKAYKMYVGGAFVRSETGRYFQAPRRDAKAARTPTSSTSRAARARTRATPCSRRRTRGDGWAARTAYNRGQILYRLAEVMESRTRRAARRRSSAAGRRPSDAAHEVEAAIDRAVYYAGFCDKYQALVASHNPVAGPHFGFSVPEPMGVVGDRRARAARAARARVDGAPGRRGRQHVRRRRRRATDPRTAVVWCECLATSDLPGGVVNVLTGQASEMAPHLAKHREVTAMDAWSADAELRAAVEREGSGNVKRVRTHDAADAAALEGSAGQGLTFIERFLETKTVWHPVGV